MSIIPAIPGGEYRPEQERIAEKMQEAVLSLSNAVIEAGTGVGKTLAALFAVKPVLEEGGVVVYSTHTKGLQGQLWKKDLPLYSELTGLPLRSSILKGKSNYVCLQDLYSLQEDIFYADDPDYKKIVEWASDRETSGEREHLPVQVPWVQEIVVKTETCRKGNCPLYHPCKYYRARDEIYRSSLVVVNHALYLSAVALGEESFLPEHSVVIFDEAHHLETVATDAFGIQIASHEAGRLLDRMTRWKIKSAPVSLMRDIYQVNLALFGLMEMLKPGVRLEQALGRRMSHYLKMLETMETLLLLLFQQLDMIDLTDQAYLRGHVESAKKYVLSLVERFSAFQQECSEGDVRYVQQVGGHLLMQQSPIEVGERLRRSVWDRFGISHIAMSATLSTSGHFSYYKSRVGLTSPIEHIEGSPFRFEEVAILYQPNLPEPPAGNNEGYSLWLDRCAEEIKRLIALTGGGVFVLCTSKAAMAHYSQRLEEEGIEFRKQGDAPVEDLLSWFREHGDGVLLGLSTFWEGVDVQGDALRCVIIDRLPFAVPDDPLHEARVDMIKKRGGDWFADLALPSCMLRMKQGFGRLIRSKTDIGIVAVLDSRLHNKSYGRSTRMYLPPAKYTRHFEAIAAWWNSKTKGN